MARTLILSDIHLGFPDVPCGRPARSAQSLAPLFDSADHLIFNGDTADIHHDYHRDNALRMLEETMNIASRSGVMITRINGNHDFDPAQVDFVDLFAGTILVTHGHGFGESMVPWTPAHAQIARALHVARERYPNSIDGFLRAAGEAAMLQWRDAATYREPTALLSIGLNPRRILRVISWWRKFPREAMDFADRFRPDARVIVCGHSHRGGSWMAASASTGIQRRVLNTGGFTFPSSPRAVIIDDSPSDIDIELRAIVHGRGRYTLGERRDASCWRIHRPASNAR